MYVSPCESIVPKKKKPELKIRVFEIFSKQYQFKNESGGAFSWQALFIESNDLKNADTTMLHLIFKCFLANAMLYHQLIQLPRADTGFLSSKAYLAFRAGKQFLKVMTFKILDN